VNLGEYLQDRMSRGHKEFILSFTVENGVPEFQIEPRGYSHENPKHYVMLGDIPVEKDSNTGKLE